MYSRNDIRGCSRISDLIDYGESIPFSSDKLHYRKVLEFDNGDKIQINYLAIYDKYYSLLKEKAKLVTLSESEYDKYKFKPKLLCMDVYNNIDMAPLILRINNMLSVTDFTKRTLLLFKKDINIFLNEILVLESDNINRNIDETERKIRE